MEQLLQKPFRVIRQLYRELRQELRQRCFWFIRLLFVSLAVGDPPVLLLLRPWPTSRNAFEAKAKEEEKACPKASAKAGATSACPRAASDDFGPIIYTDGAICGSYDICSSDDLRGSYGGSYDLRSPDDFYDLCSPDDFLCSSRVHCLGMSPGTEAFIFLADYKSASNRWIAACSAAVMCGMQNLGAKAAIN